MRCLRLRPGQRCGWCSAKLDQNICTSLPKKPAAWQNFASDRATSQPHPVQGGGGVVFKTGAFDSELLPCDGGVKRSARRATATVPADREVNVALQDHSQGGNTKMVCWGQGKVGHPATVLVQSEMEKRFFPLVQIPPLRGGDFQGMRVYRPMPVSA